MPDLPRIPQRLKRPDVIIEVLCLIILLESWTFAVYTYNHFPEWVSLFYQTSTNLTHERYEIWIFPILATLTYVAISWVCSFPHKLHYKQPITPLNAGRIYRAKQRNLRLIKLTLVLIFGISLFVYVYISKP